MIRFDPHFQAILSLRKARLAAVLWDFSTLLEEVQSIIHWARDAIRSADPSMVTPQAPPALDIELPDANILEIEGVVLLSRYYSMKDQLKAIEMGEKALQLAREKRLGDLEAGILQHLSDYLIRSDPEKGLVYAMKSLSIYRSRGDLYGEGQAMNVAASCLAEMGDFKQAYLYAEESWKICHQLGNLFVEIWSLQNLYQYCNLQGRLDLIYDRMLEAVEYSVELENAYLQALPHFALSDYYFRDGDFSRSHQHAEQCLHLVNKGDLRGQPLGTTLPRLDPF